MSDQSCESITDLLVQYADGELCESDAQQVAAHLAECSQCRSELRLLQRSLELARAVWQEAAGDAAAVPIRDSRPRPRRLPAVVGLATCAAVLLVAMVWLSLRDRSRPDVKQTVRNGHATEHPAREGPAREMEDIDVEAFIAGEVRSARLAVAVQLLATEPGLKPYKDQAERYLVETYGRTAAGVTRVPRGGPPSTSIKEPRL